MTVPRAVVGLVVAAAYSGWVATTTPFTVGSDVAVAVGLAGIAVVAARALHARRRRRLPQPSPADQPSPAERPEQTGRLVLWVAVIGLLLAVELVSYFAGSSNRYAFPTASSLLDAAERSTAAKAAVVLAWVGLGWGLFRQ